MTERGTPMWVAFAAGAVAMLAIVLLFWLWQGRDEGVEFTRTAAAAANAVPEIRPPSLPDAPRLPDAPIPIPR